MAHRHRSTSNYRGPEIPDRLLLALMFVMIGCIILLDYDRLALSTPVGRFVLADLAMVAFVLTLTFVDRPSRFSREGIFIVFFLVGLGVTGFVSIIFLNLVAEVPNVGRALTDSIRYLLYGAVVFFLSPILAVREYYQYYLKGLIVCYAIVLAVGFGQIFAVLGVPVFDSLFDWRNIRGRGTRVAGTFRWQGPLVLFIGLMLPVLSAKIYSDIRRRAALTYSLLALGGIIVIFFTGSRSAFLVLPFSLLPVLIIALQRREWKMFYPFMFGVVVFTLLTIFDIGAVSRATERMFDAIVAPTDESRFRIWSAAIAAMTDTSILFGIGPRQTTHIVGNAPHSGYIAFLVERGVIGFLLFLGLIIGLIRVSTQLLSAYFRGASPIAIGVASMVPVLLVFSVANSAVTGRITPLVIALILSTHKLEVKNETQ